LTRRCWGPTGECLVLVDDAAVRPEPERFDVTVPRTGVADLADLAEAEEPADMVRLAEP